MGDVRHNKLLIVTKNRNERDYLLHHVVLPPNLSLE